MDEFFRNGAKFMGELGQQTLIDEMIQNCNKNLFPNERNRCIEAIWKAQHQMEIEKLDRKQKLAETQLKLWKTRLNAQMGTQKMDRNLNTNMNETPNNIGD